MKNFETSTCHLEQPELSQGTGPFENKTPFNREEALADLAALGFADEDEDVSSDVDFVSEKEIKSKFSVGNFSPENSFDAYAKKHYPELSELKNKCVYDTPAMETPDHQINRTSRDEYTEKERKYIKEARDRIDAPTPETVMQKIICVDTGDINKDLDLYFNPRNLDGKRCNAHVGGCVAKAEDATPFSRTPQECYENFRLDYTGTKYIDPGQPVYIVRFTDGTNYDIPYSREFGGEKECASPMTGNGFIAGEKCTIPEYTVHPYDKKGAIVTDGVIYRVYPDGAEDLVARYSKIHHKFKPTQEVGK